MINLESIFTAWWTLARTEILRFLVIWKQTILAPIINQVLYLLIFGTVIGARFSVVENISYINFIIPGLILMTIIINAFSNTIFGFFMQKFHGNIEELMVSSMPKSMIILGFAAGGIVRGLVAGFAVFVVSLFFTEIIINSLWIVIVLALLTSIIFSLFGILAGIFARSFDDAHFVPTFILTPLSFLGGIFYAVDNLSEFWQTISKINPIYYMIDGFRFGFYGQGEVNIWLNISILSIIIVIIFLINLWLLKRGVGIKS